MGSDKWPEAHLFIDNRLHKFFVLWIRSVFVTDLSIVKKSVGCKTFILILLL